MNNLKNPRPLDYWLLWLVALLSLAANVWLLSLLIGVQYRIGEAAALAAQALADLKNSSIDYSLPVHQVVPVALVVPISTTVSVPISTTLPIDIQVTVPLNTFLGTFPINVPIHTTIPVNIQPEIPLHLSIPISTTVPLALNVPIQITLADTSLGQSLAKAQVQLEKLAGDLQAGPFSKMTR